MLQGTNRIKNRSTSGGTSRNGTHRTPPQPHTHRRSSGPSLTGGCVVRPTPAVLRPPPTPFRLTARFPGYGYRAATLRRPTPQGRRAGEGLPSSRRHLPNVPRPLRRGVLRGCASRLYTPSMAFAVKDPARLSLSPVPQDEHTNGAAGFA